MKRACVVICAAIATSCGSGEGGGGAAGIGGAGACAQQPCTVSTDCSAQPEQHEGDATYYDFADGSGACSFDPSPGDLMIGAMNHVDYADSATCGGCVRLAGPSAAITIRLVDQCPECPEGDIDLSPEAFAQIAELSAGRVPITWSYVGCGIEGPVVYHFKEGSNEWWTAVQVRNHRYPVATFEYRADDGSYRRVARESYNYFVEPNGMGPGPYTFRLTDVNGQVVEDTAIPHMEAGDAPGAGQFPACAP
jgi:expansin